MPFTTPDEQELGAGDEQRATFFQTDVNALVAGIAGDGVVLGCEVTAQGSPNNTVAVAAGAVKVGTTYAVVAAGNVTMPAADGSNPRWVLITADTAGAKAATAGTAAAEPVLPDIPANSVTLAAIWWPASDTTVAAGQITDKRVMIGADPPDMRLKLAGTTFYDAPGIGLEGWRTIGFDQNRIYYYPMVVRGRTLSVAEMAFTVTSAGGAGSTGRVAIYRANLDAQPLSLVAGATGIAVDTTGKKTASISATLPPGNYLRAIWFTAGVALGQRFGYGPAVGALVNDLTEYQFVRRVYANRDTTAFTSWADPGTAWTAYETGNQGWEEVLYLAT